MPAKTEVHEALRKLFFSNKECEKKPPVILSNNIRYEYSKQLQIQPADEALFSAINLLIVQYFNWPFAAA